MLEFIIGLAIGVVGTAIASFFIAKNNKDKMLRAFEEIDGLPQRARDLLDKFKK